MLCFGGVRRGEGLVWKNQEEYRQLDVQAYAWYQAHDNPPDDSAQEPSHVQDRRHSWG